MIDAILLWMLQGESRFGYGGRSLEDDGGQEAMDVVRVRGGGGAGGDVVARGNGR